MSAALTLFVRCIADRSADIRALQQCTTVQFRPWLLG